MIKLMFYHGPGDMVTRTIRRFTLGPYSHVELQFTDGCRFFSSGHGIHLGTHMIRDRKIYDRLWDTVLLPTTEEQERKAERYIFHLIGSPFDWRGIAAFLVPILGRRRKPRYCSSVILDVLQQSLHMFPGLGLRISPNGFYRLIVAGHPLIIAEAAPEVAPPCGVSQSIHAAPRAQTTGAPGAGVWRTACTGTVDGGP
jgi:hypothetical protein